VKLEAGERQEKAKMKAMRYCVFAMLAAITAIASAQNAKPAGHESASERLIGAWRLQQIPDEHWFVVWERY